MLTCNILFPCKHEQSFCITNNIFFATPVVQLLARRLHHFLHGFVNWRTPCCTGDVELGARRSLAGVSGLVAAHRLVQLFSIKCTNIAYLIVDFCLLSESIQSLLEQLYWKEALDPVFSPGMLGNTLSLLLSENRFLFNDTWKIHHFSSPE